MSNIPLSTEARIFARQVIREVKRREPIGASAFAGKPVKTWPEATFPLFERISRDIGVFTQQAIASTRKRLDNLPETDRGYVCGGSSTPSTYLDMVTLHGDDHTLTVMEGLEEAVIVQRHCYDLRFARGADAFSGIVTANVSEHVFGRFYERSTNRPDVKTGVSLALVCGHIGMVAMSDKRLGHSEINFMTDGVMLTGSMKVSRHAGGGPVTAFFDCRTVLPMSAVNEQQIEQALVVEACCFGGQADVASIPLIARRQDYVLETLAASKRSKH
jgi:hypothetical protein